MPPRRSSWMDPDLDDFRDLARTFCEKEIKPNVDAYIANRQVDRGLWNKAGDVGLLCLSIPEEYGGGGGTFAHEAILIEEQARATDSSWGVSLHNGIVAHYLLAYGTDEQKRAWLPQMASGEVVGAIAMTEPGTGSDLQNVTTKAIRRVTSTSSTEPRPSSPTAPRPTSSSPSSRPTPSRRPPASPSCSSRPTPPASPAEGARQDRMKGQDTSELVFSDVRVPVSALLGAEEGQGFAQLMDQLPQERLLVAVANVAAMEMCLDETLRYVHDRHAFNRPIWAFQNTKFKMAEVATEARVARSFLDECIALHLEGRLDIPTAAMVKLWCSERAQRVADTCLQLHGGYGYMNEYPIARAWADLRVSQIYAGTSEIMKEIISRSLTPPA